VVKEYGSITRYCFQFKQFLIFNGILWQEDGTGEAVRLVKQTQAALYRWAAEQMKELAGEGDDEDEARAAKVAALRKLLAHLLRWESAKAIKDCLEFMKSQPGIPVLPAQLDSHPYLLNLQNGTYDLKAGRLRAHDPNDYITKHAPAEFDASASCPLWLQCLDRWMNGNRNLTEYLQRVVGYSPPQCSQQSWLNCGKS
jgi:putative DNA primase/helicase